MQYKKMIWAGVLAISVSGLVGCGITKTSIDAPPPGANGGNVANNTDTTASTLYFADENGYVVPMKMSLPKTEAPATSVLEHMIRSDQALSALTGTGLQTVIPEGTKLSVNMKDNGLAVVDFAKGIESLKTDKEEQRMVDAVVWALTEFPTVKEVQFTIQGQHRSTLTHKTPIGQPMSRANGINMEVSSNINPSNTDQVTVYFEGQNQAGNFHYLVPVTRVIAKNGENVLTNTIEQLANGPWEQTPALKPTLSSATKLKSAKVQDGVAIVDFSESLMSKGATPEQKKLFDALVLSITESAHVQKVMVTENGKAPTASIGMDLSKPVNKPQFVNQKEL